MKMLRVFSGFANIHPLQDESTVQGAMELLYDLQDISSRNYRNG